MKRYTPIQQVYTIPANSSITIDNPFCGYESIGEKYHVLIKSPTQKLLYEIVNLNGTYNTYGLIGDHVLVDVEGVTTGTDVQLKITNNEPTDHTAILAKYKEESYGLRVSHECEPIISTAGSTIEILDINVPTKALINVGNEYMIEMLALPNDEHSISYLGSGPYDVGVQFGKLYVNNSSTNDKNVNLRFTTLDDLCSTKTFDVTLNPNETQVVDMSMLNTSEAVKWIFGSDDLLCELTALESNGNVYTDTYYIGNFITSDVSFVSGDRLLLTLTNDSTQVRRIKGTQLRILNRC